MSEDIWQFAKGNKTDIEVLDAKVNIILALFAGQFLAFVGMLIAILNKL